MIVEILLTCLAVVLIVAYREYRKELKRLNDIITTYDESDKVIKNCVVYSALPLTVAANNTGFISCRFENLGMTGPTKQLKKILGMSKPKEKA